MKQVGLPELSKIEYFPYNHSQIYFRIENLEDTFDHHPSKEKEPTPYFNSTKFTEMVYRRVHNRELTEKDYYWAGEMSLSGNELRESMLEQKVIWVGDDDDFVEDYKYPKDKSDTVVSLEPQRIRMFYMEFFYWDGEDWGELDDDTLDDEETQPIA